MCQLFNVIRHVCHNDYLRYDIYIFFSVREAVRFSIAITQFRVTIAMNCMHVSYVVGHERESSLLFQCIVSIV